MYLANTEGGEVQELHFPDMKLVGSYGGCIGVVRSSACPSGREGKGGPVSQPGSGHIEAGPPGAAFRTTSGRAAAVQHAGTDAGRMDAGSP